ncbi:MAG: cell surface protein SprA [Bacteroidia bacterium]
MSKFSLAMLVSAITSFFFADTGTTGKEAEVCPQVEVISTDSFFSVEELLTPDGDTSKVKSNPNNRIGDATRQEYVTPLYLGNPGNLETIFELNDDGSGFNIYERVGKVDFRRPSYISYEDFLEYRKKKSQQDYFREQSMSANAESRQGLALNIDIEELSDVFGGGSVSIRPTGFATLDFSIDHNRTDNPSLPLRQQRTTTFNFDQQIQLGVIGQIGEKLRLNANFDTQATFDFENELKLEHSGTEDQILQKIEAGNVNMQLGNSLIQGRQNLFGLKTKLRFGPVYVTAIASTERGKVETINISGGGAIETPFEKEVSDYDMNRHFFLSHYFRSTYERALANLPVIQSNLRINRVEVWIEQQGSTSNNRNAVGFVDLGENDLPFGQGVGRVYNDNLQRNTNIRVPDNDANNLFSLLENDPAIREQNTAKSAIENLPGLNMANTEDFQVLGNMRRLNPNEYTVNNQLGYISLNSPIPTDQVLFIAYNFTLNGQVHQVGEFSDDVPANGLNSNVLYLRMLKSSVLRINPFPAWDLMMKNIYSVGYGLQRDGFFLDIKYESGTSAGRINFLPTGAVANRPLIQVMELDRLTNHTSAGPDNYFDFVEGITILSDKGLVIFPVLEPFGSHLATKLNNDPDAVATYVFQPLYDDTQQGAIQNHPELNRFTLEGYYRSSSSSEIPLNTFNLSEGSVTVTAGGRTLSEGSDYQVDYYGGKVTIINPSILTSGQDIAVSFESNSLYNIQTKTLLGSRAEFSPSDNLQLGATILNLREQPFNQKTTLGDEPLNNTLWGLDASFRRESPLLTKLIDRLPLISTKETSTIDAAAEFAQFIPGTPAINKTQTEKGIVFLDDFEAAATPFGLQGTQRWKLASFPEGNTKIFNPEYAGEPLSTNFTRAKLAWYQIDQAFYQRFGIKFPEEDLSNNYTRQVQPFELFPTAKRAFGNNIQNTFDLHFNPNTRGPYNYEYRESRLRSADGTFVRPEDNWAGIMREIDVNNDFEATNVEFVEFWMMDPFMDNPNHKGGEFYVNLGLVNEDILTDESLSRENGLPGAGDPGNLQETPWGRIPIGNPPVNAFSNNPDDRIAQDIGFDGLNDEAEAIFFSRVLDSLRTFLSPAAMAQLEADPSTDNFKHFRDDSYEADEAGVLERYKDFNGLENNSPVGQDNRNYTVQATQLPDNEDLNNNGSLNFAEQYWEYRIKLHPDSLQRGMNFVVDKITDTVNTAQGVNTPVTWYQFRIPLNTGRPVNNITNFKTISFMRMYMTGFQEEVITRLTEFQLVSTQWRRFSGNLNESGIATPPEPPFATFELGSVSLEENSQKLPFNYTLPPGVVQQSINGNTAAGFLQDERSLTMKVCDLKDGDARGMFKNTKSDLRLYNRLKMWVHAEATESGVMPSNFYQYDDARVFIRLGLDNDQNYYEYEIPLTPSDPAISNSKTNTWLSANEFDFELALLALAKDDRNTAGTGLIYRHAYRNDSMPEGHVIYIKGTPKLSDVRNIMIGVRNPSDPDARPICLELWVNELRLTNFDKTKGWAANANISVKLADIGSISANAAYKSSGFGPLEQRLSTRSQEDVLRYDLAGNLYLDKLFPKKWGLQMPVYATIGEQRISPVFNPQEADVRTDILLEQLDPKARSEKLMQIQDFRSTKSLSFNNWRKNKSQGTGGGGGGPGGGRPGTNARPGGATSVGGQGGKGTGDRSGGGGGGRVSYPWDISNFDFTYAYNENFSRNAVIERRFNTQHRGAINYRYNFPQLVVEPFKNIKAFEKIQFLKDFNFSPLPTAFNVSITGDRQFEERQMRATELFGGQVTPTFTKNFLINRNYNLTWNFTRNLQLSYTANNISRVDEVKGYWKTASEAEIDSVGSLMDNLLHIGKDPSRGHDNLINFGRTTQFTHNFNAAYQVPFNKFKMLDWVSSTVNYSGSFNWAQAPEINPGLGATIGNTQNIQGNGRLDLNSLYRKVGFLKKILDGQNKAPQGARPPQAPQNTGPRIENRVGENPVETDTTNKPDPFRFLKLVGKEVIRVGLSVRSIDFTYSNNAGTILPGYLPKTDNFGLDFGYYDSVRQGTSPLLPPTYGFIMGSQRDIRNEAGENNWITRDTLLSNLFLKNRNEILTARTSVELFKGFRIDISANRTESKDDSEFFRWDPSEDRYRSFDPLNNGSFSMSYIFINSAFEKGWETSAAFDEFSSNRSTISGRLSARNPNNARLTPRTQLIEGGFQNGYLGTNQDVLIPSLLSAYGVISSEKIALSNFPRIPLPNWSINYNGLSNIPLLKKYFNSVTLKHTYRGTYSVGNYTNNLNALTLGGFPARPDTVGTDNFGLIENFYSIENIQTVQIMEQFAPLLGVNVNMKNGATAQIDYKRGRQMNFNVGNLQLTEMRNQDLAVMIGYRKDKLNLSFNFGGKNVNLKNSVNFQFRATMRDTKEINRNLGPTGTSNDQVRLPEITRGTYNFILSPSIDYVVNTRLNVKLFFERNINNPYVANAFRTAFTSGGVQIRFTLAN